MKETQRMEWSLVEFLNRGLDADWTAVQVVILDRQGFESDRLSKTFKRDDRDQVRDVLWTCNSKQRNLVRIEAVA